MLFWYAWSLVNPIGHPIIKSMMNWIWWVSRVTSVTTAGGLVMINVSKALEALLGCLRSELISILTDRLLQCNPYSHLCTFSDVSCPHEKVERDDSHPQTLLDVLPGFAFIASSIHAMIFILIVVIHGDLMVGTTLDS